MNKIITFIKTTIVGGLVVIVPLAVLAFIVGDTVNSLIAVTQPLTEDLPFDAFTNTLIALLLVIAVIIAVCFTAGFILNTFWGRTIKDWFEKTLLERIPMYSTLRGLTQKFAGINDAAYPVVEVDLYDSDSRVLGILVDTLPDKRGVVYVPSSPIITVGQLHILPRTCITETELSMSETISCLSQMGLEANNLYKKVSLKNV